MTRSTYEGFRSTIKAVGTGPRGARPLSFAEARAAMAAILAGEVSDGQAGAFLIAMRIKGETPEELAGLAQALRDAALPMHVAADRPLGRHAGAQARRPRRRRPRRAGRDRPPRPRRLGRDARAGRRGGRARG